MIRSACKAASIVYLRTFPIASYVVVPLAAGTEQADYGIYEI